MLSQLVPYLPRLRQLRLATYATGEMNPVHQRAVIAMLNASSSLVSVILSLCDTYTLGWGVGWGAAWHLPQEYEVHTEHSFTRSPPKMKIIVGLERLGRSAYHWRPV